jgi:hypothetical protein
MIRAPRGGVEKKLEITMKRKLTWVGGVPRCDCGRGPYLAKRAEVKE